MKTPKSQKPIANVKSVEQLEQELAEKKQKDIQARADKFMPEYRELVEKYKVELYAVPVSQQQANGSIVVGAQFIVGPMQEQK